MKNDYVLSESDSDNVFAVISSDNRTDLINLVSLAIKEEFSYEKVTFRDDSYSERSGTVFMSFNCLGDGDEDEDSEIREVELNLTAIYNTDGLITVDDKINILKRTKKEMCVLSILGLVFLLGYSYGCFKLNYFKFDEVIFYLLIIEIVVMIFFYFKANLKLKKLYGTT